MPDPNGSYFHIITIFFFFNTVERLSCQRHCGAFGFNNLNNLHVLKCDSRRFRHRGQRLLRAQRSAEKDPTHRSIRVSVTTVNNSDYNIMCKILLVCRKETTNNRGRRTVSSGDRRYGNLRSIHEVYRTQNGIGSSIIINKKKRNSLPHKFCTISSMCYRYVIINRCPVDDKLISRFRGSWSESQVFETQVFAYMKTFRFTGSPALYIECDVRMCHGRCPVS